MTRAVFRKSLGALRPADELAEELLAKIEPSREVTVEVVQSRNPHHHRLAFAMFKWLWQNTDGRWDNPEDVRHWLLCKTGHCRYIDVDGHRCAIADSMSYASMDNTAFRDFWNRALDVIVTEVLPGTDRESLDREFWKLVGLPYSSAA